MGLQEDEKNTRLDRINELMVITGKTRDDFMDLGFTESQISGWFAKPGSCLLYTSPSPRD